MKEESKNDIPKYLEEFLEPTRSSVEKLMAAFDGLSVETQIKLLVRIEEKISQFGFPNMSYLYKKVFFKAFESSNSYVRYLSVRNLVDIMYGDKEELDNFIILVEKDKSSLVRNARFEKISRPLSSEVIIGDGFFTKQTHDERLARVRNAHLNGKFFARELEEAARDNYFENQNALIELIELIDEYLSNDLNIDFYERQREYVDGWLDYEETKELKALWNVIPKLPDLAGRLLVKKLPHNAKMGKELYEDILNDLTDEQLDCLLSRADIRAEEFRKEVFWRDEIPNEDEYAPYTQFWAQASFYHFKMNDDEFGKILSLNAKEQQKRLECLSQSDSLELYQYLAIIRILTNLDKDSWDNWYIDYAVDSLKKRLNTINFDKDNQLINLRLFDSACESKNWKNSDSEDLFEVQKMLYPLKVEGDVWKTFLAFKDAFKESEYTIDNLYRIEYEDWEEEEQEKELDGKLVTVFDELFFQVASIKKMITETRFLIIVIAVVSALAIVF